MSIEGSRKYAFVFIEENRKWIQVCLLNKPERGCMCVYLRNYKMDTSNFTK